jgi:diguanylate cyclase (GGDEF)-like protein/PAS domain S-box-containing protein
MRRRGPSFRPLASRGRRTIVAILVVFALFSVFSIVISTRATARSRNRAAVVQVAARQRTLAERYVNDVLLSIVGGPANPGYTASLLRQSSKVLLDGGEAPAVNGDDDETRLSAVTDPLTREQLMQQRRLVDDLIKTGSALRHGSMLNQSRLTAGEHIDTTRAVDRLRVVAALTENVSLNAARTIASSTDHNISDLMSLQILLGVGGLLVALLLGGALVAATRRQTAHFRSLVTASTDLVLVFGRGGCNYASTSVATMVGCAETDLLGLGFADYVHDDDRSVLETVRATGEPREFVFRMTNRFGEWRHLEAHVTDLRRDRRIRGIVVNSRDITERVRLEGELTHRAFHDELTGLANRALFRDRLDHALARSARSHDPVAVLLTDLDWFKQVNDTLGHDAGDQLLRELSRRLERSLRPSDTVARLGGDEFVILLEGTSEQEASELAGRLLERLRSEPVEISGRDLVVSASIGMVVHGGGPGDSEDLMRRADLAMYAAKDAGRGRVETFRTDMMRDASELLGMEHDLRRGLKHGEITVHYQPSYEIATHRIVGVEALVRWRSPSRGVVPPDRFVPVAEAAGLIHELGEFVLREAALQTTQWVRDGLVPPDFVTWVNLSAVQLSDRRIAEIVGRTLRSVGLETSWLGLEVTETAIVVEGSPAEQAREVLRDLHDQGFGIALDDFGTGFSSLEHLRRFPIDIIKIDRSFIQGIEHNPKDAAIAANLVSLAHALGLVAVAEGIETPGQLEQLRELGCDLGQGYLLGRPAPAVAVSELLAAQRTPAASGTA